MAIRNPSRDGRRPVPYHELKYYLTPRLKKLDQTNRAEKSRPDASFMSNVPVSGHLGRFSGRVYVVSRCSCPAVVSRLRFKSVPYKLCAACRLQLAEANLYSGAFAEEVAEGKCHSLRMPPSYFVHLQVVHAYRLPTRKGRPAKLIHRMAKDAFKSFC